MSGGWTDARIATLKSMWADGTPGGDIAAALGITRNAVIGKANRLNLDARAPRGNRRLDWHRVNAKVRALWDDGIPTIRIAKTLGIAECTARRALHAMGLPSHGKTNSHGLGSSPLSSTEAPGPVARAGAPATSSRAAPGHAQLLPDLAPVATNAIGAPFGNAVTIDALTPYTCRWPFGGHGEPATHFCGATCPASVPYCSTHAALAYNAEYRARRMTAAPTSSKATLDGYGHADRFLGGE